MLLCSCQRTCATLFSRTLASRSRIQSVCSNPCTRRSARKRSSLPASRPPFCQKALLCPGNRLGRASVLQVQHRNQRRLTEPGEPSIAFHSPLPRGEVQHLSNRPKDKVDRLVLAYPNRLLPVLALGNNRCFQCG